MRNQQIDKELIKNVQTKRKILNRNFMWLMPNILFMQKYTIMMLKQVVKSRREVPYYIMPPWRNIFRALTYTGIHSSRINFSTCHKQINKARDLHRCRHDINYNIRNNLSNHTSQQYVTASK